MFTERPKLMTGISNGPTMRVYTEVCSEVSLFQLVPSNSVSHTDVHNKVIEASR